MKGSLWRKRETPKEKRMKSDGGFEEDPRDSYLDGAEGVKILICVYTQGREKQRERESEGETNGAGNWCG